MTKMCTRTCLRCALVYDKDVSRTCLSLIFTYTEFNPHNTVIHCIFVV